MVKPTLIDPRPHAPSDGAEIVQPLGATVNFKGGEKKSSAFEHSTQTVKSAFIGHCSPLCTLAVETNL